jgi:hypothetical protein
MSNRCKVVAVSCQPSAISCLPFGGELGGSLVVWMMPKPFVISSAARNPLVNVELWAFLNEDKPVFLQIGGFMIV